MLRLFCSVLVILAAALTGCTRIAAVKPVGEPIPFKETAELAGDWLGPKGKTYTVTADAAAEQFHVAFDGEHGRENMVFKLTTVSENVSILWLKDEELKGWLLLRVVGGDDSISLLSPEEDQIAKLVSAGTLSGTQDKKKNSWLLSDERLAPVLVPKDVWNIGYAQAFVRLKPAPASTPATATPPPSPPVAPSQPAAPKP